MKNSQNCFTSNSMHYSSIITVLTIGALNNFYELILIIFDTIIRFYINNYDYNTNKLNIINLKLMIIIIILCHV